MSKAFYIAPDKSVVEIDGNVEHIDRHPFKSTFLVYDNSTYILYIHTHRKYVTNAVATNIIELFGVDPSVVATGSAILAVNSGWYSSIEEMREIVKAGVIQAMSPNR